MSTETLPARITIHPEPMRAHGTKDGVRAGGASASADKATEGNFWGEDGFTFGDLIDLINPLQHIPLVSTVYRKITGDEIAPGPRLIGGAALGGVVGFAVAVANSAVEEATGKDIGENVMALFGGGAEQPVALADNGGAVEKAVSENGSAYEAPVPSPYNKKASKLYQQRERITEVEQLARFERQRLNVEA